MTSQRYVVAFLALRTDPETGLAWFVVEDETDNIMLGPVSEREARDAAWDMNRDAT